MEFEMSNLLLVFFLFPRFPLFGVYAGVISWGRSAVCDLRVNTHKNTLASEVDDRLMFWDIASEGSKTR